ncbi:crossover junction endodeoxyribonuclease RuvC [Chengkuizengella marina]|uniref:Crossover junction endodeoxyribonuclease RuvC n=1 Tax=Chengkuizengella marina TaxID=2507566 RepID=A0A6N9Q0A6_9BACL|nr:crossover junction endodeoxyribonuclease RuvC [Chengkuizengella marina]NBI28325.1 crossover junction endodeoxyribonuclease RuvC [Chengkuizengella marina]
MKILGIDHGTNYTGWSLMEKDKVERFGLLDYTEIEYPAIIPMFYHDIKRLIELVKPQCLVLEKPMHFRNANTVRALVGVYSMAMLAGFNAQIIVKEITPNELKEISKNGRDKWDVAVAIQQKYGLDFDEIAVPIYYKVGKKKGQVRKRLFDPADAIALCWAYNQKIKKGVA